MGGPNPRQRLYDAATRREPAGVIDAAVAALVAGLDSPSLGMLAGASPKDRADEITPLLDATLAELGIPRPASLAPWRRIDAEGRTFSRLPTDTVRFDVVPAGEDVGGFALRVHVNDVELTAAGAGLGMDPFDVLIPDNRLVATAEPRVVPIARCTCGVYGCGATDVRIVRDDDRVHWDWLLEAPVDHGVTFPADQYDAEVARIHADRSWQRPQDTVARLVLERVDPAALAVLGLTISWVAADHRDDGLVRVALLTGDGEGAGYQVFLRFPWRDRAPDDVADEVARTLAQPPATWLATFHSIRRGVPARPKLAGPGWRGEEIR